MPASMDYCQGTKAMEINTFLQHQEKETENITKVKEFYKALNKGDRAVFKFLVDDPTWDVSPGWPDGGRYHGKVAVFGTFYKTLLNRLYHLLAEPEVYVDGGDIVTVLGFYNIVFHEGEPVVLVRFSHTWKIAADGRIAGVWQVADSSLVWARLKAE